MEGQVPPEGAQKAENPYLDSDFDFGKENAFMLNEIQSDIAFNLNKIQQKYIYSKMGKKYYFFAKKNSLFFQRKCTDVWQIAKRRKARYGKSRAARRSARRIL